MQMLRISKLCRPIQRSFSTGPAVANVLLPARMHIGGDSTAMLGDVLRDLDATNPLIVTDGVMKKLGKLDDLTKGLETQFAVFADTVEDPTTDVCELGFKLYRAGGHDSMVALGGGSVMDTAKGIQALLVSGERPLRELKVPVNLTSTAAHPACPLVAIPTTAGTGSEVTKFTVITDTASNEKMLLRGSAMVPTVALVDWKHTITAPFRTTADTGMDALTHAIESYVSKLATPFTQGLARLAMQRIAKHIRTACADSGNVEAKAAMMLAATEAGMAFSNSSVALVHGMSRPYGGFFHIPHGLGNAMLLAPLSQWAITEGDEHVKQLYADCAEAMDLCTAGTSADKACALLIAELTSLNADLKVPSVKDFGVDKDQYFASIDTMVSQAFGSGSPNNNPVVPTEAQARKLYELCYEGR